MMNTLTIRSFLPEDAHALRDVFYSAVHQSTTNFYSLAQRQAWAPEAYCFQDWLDRLIHNHPIIAVVNNRQVGYTDLQADGYIDHFFVHVQYQRQGVGQALMTHLIQQATQAHYSHLYSDVSLAAEALFLANHFTIEERQTVSLRGCQLINARMRRKL